MLRIVLPGGMGGTAWAAVQVIVVHCASCCADVFIPVLQLLTEWSDFVPVTESSTTTWKRGAPPPNGTPVSVPNAQWLPFR
jgi:hypothetical protein